MDFLAVHLLDLQHKIVHHLNCIGSEFNLKGAMVCPNCGDTEVGNWLYGDDPAPSLSDSSSDEGIFMEDPYGYDFAEDPYELPWFAFSGLTGGHSSFESYRQVESSTIPNRELLGDHAIFAEHMAASPLAHSHVNVSPIPSATMSEASVIVDDPIFNYRRNGQSGHASLPPQTNPTSLLYPITYVVRSPVELSLLEPAPQGGSSIFPHSGGQNLHEENSDHIYRLSLLAPAPQGGSSILPHSGSQNIHEENSDHIYRFPIMSSDRVLSWGSQQQASGGADPSHGSGNVWREWL